MATIEPRLIHLLNSSRTPDLPPIQNLPLESAGQSLSLPPLGPDLKAGHRDDKPAPTQLPPRCVASDDPLSKPVSRADDGSGLLTASIRPLQLLLGEPPEPAVPTIPLHKIVDDVPGSPEDASNNKRQRALSAKDDFIQLPKLPKKQKSAQQVVPPIIAGLREPPPDAAVFPRITPASGDNSEAFPLASWKEFSSGPEDRPAAHTVVDAAKSSAPKPKRRPMKPRKKWTEEETNDLLRGVSRYGVGRWTTILEDPEFKFNNRTAGDLKDRFRTCCPEELRLTSPEDRPAKGNSGPAAATDGDGKPKSGPELGNLLAETGDDTADKEGAAACAPPKRRKSRAHRKRLEDLAKLGIYGPFERSRRRKRRPFTKQDDEEILDGLEQYGPSWSRIQRDPRYNLSSRQPTDLRDRVRNKYPQIYARIEKANLQAKEAARGKGSVLEPSVSTAAESTAIRHSLEPQLNRSGSREDMVRPPPPVAPPPPPPTTTTSTTPSAHESTESLPGLADIFEMHEPVSGVGCSGGNSGGSFLGGGPSDMDLGHLLLDDPHGSASEHFRLVGHDTAPAPLPHGGIAGHPDSRLG